MKFENLFHILLIFLLTTGSCKQKSAKEERPLPAQIQLSADSSAVELHHVNAELLEYLKQDSLSQKDWESFFAVYPDPGNEELRDIQKPIQGTYLRQDSLILFLPREKFKKGLGYFARYYYRHVLNKPSDVIREGKLGESDFIEFSFQMRRVK